jgi:hypothetical protein
VTKAIPAMTKPFPLATKAIPFAGEMAAGTLNPQPKLETGS